MHTFLRIAVVLSLLVGLTAGAQASGPTSRVMVILDTSRSMMEYPVFSVCPACPDTAVPVTRAAGGDYDATNPVACVSKFCMAKEALNSVLPDFTDAAHIGLGTYYQYVMQADSTNTLATTCTYDVLAPADVRKSFTSLTDYTGSGMTVCAGNALSPDATCIPGSTRTVQNYFPDRSLSGSGAGLNNYCPYPTGVTTPANPTVAPTPCGADQRNCYVLTKTAAMPAAPVDCNIYTWPLPALPATFTAIANNGAGCQNGISYDTTAPASSIVYRTVAPRTEQIVSLATVSCPAAVVPTTNPMVAPSVTMMTTPVIGAAVGNWRNFSTATERCTAETPCSFFSYSASPVERFGSTAWYGFFNTGFAPFTPAATTNALSGTYQFSQYNSPPGAGYTAAVMNGSVMQANGTGCLGGAWPLGTGVGTTTRYQGGESLAGTFGIVNPQTQLQGSVVTRGTRTDDTPTRAGTNYTCTAAYPCDVTLSNDVNVPGAWVNNVATIYANVFNAANERTTAIAPDSFVLRLLAPQVACPAVGATGAAPASSVWVGAPGGCTGAGAGACAFTQTSTGTAMAGGACPNVVRWTNTGAAATPPANCAFNNKAFTGPTVSANIPVTRTIVNPATCTTGTFDIAAAGAPAYVGCGSYPCKLSYVNNSVGPMDPSPWASNIYNRTATPAGWGAAGTPAVRDQTVGTSNGPLSSGAPTCIGGNNSYVTSNDASLCPGGVTPCTLWQVGPTQITPTGCGTESGPCFACQYQQRRFQWDRPTTICNYTANTYTFTVDQTAPTCTYSRARWQLDRRDPDQHRCEYQVGALRYDFAPPTEKVCEYWSVRTTLRSSRNLYTYEYKTKGTELIGRASAVATGSNMCGANGSGYGGALQASCPETTACGAFASMVNRSTSLGGGTGPVPPTATCKLHWGGGNDATRVYGYPPYATAGGPVCGANRCLVGDTCNGGLCYTNGLLRGRARYQNFNQTFDPNPVTATTSRLCEESTTGLPASPDSYQVAWPSGAVTPGFCSNSGTPTQTTYSLVSDYYDPTVTNNLSTYTGAGCTVINPTAGPPPQPGKPCYPTGGATPAYSSVTWTQAPGMTTFNTNSVAKLQGFAARTGVPAPPSGVVPAVSLLVPIPADENLYDETTQKALIRAATDLCVMPSADVSPADGVQDGPNPNGTLRGGACIADFADRTGPGAAYGDYTPLYGAVKNASGYLQALFDQEVAIRDPATDPDPNCRDSFIILATDGLENTPASYTLTGGSVATSVEGLVGSLRDVGNADPNRPDIRTFVIGFGEGASGAGVGALNAVATAGGTSNAYFPTTLVDLKNALNTVFASITAGVESRSKPAFGTDGTRLYAAQYVKPASGAGDWYGMLSAYGVDPSTGAPGVVWQHHTKLDDPGHPYRNIRGLMHHNDHTHADPFEPGMNLRDSPMDTHPAFNGSLPDGGNPQVDDIINFFRSKGEPYDRPASAPLLRTSGLGPIVNSSPVVVGKSPFDDAYGGSSAAARASFRTYITNTETRGTRIYFASIDGMIHSVIDNDGSPVCTTSESDINCPNGREAWAAIPLFLPLENKGATGARTIGESMFKIKSTKDWGMKMLNGTVSVADVCNEDSDFGGDAANCSSNDWKTILVGTMREGGAGVVALDITNHQFPNGTSNGGANNRVLWEFTDGNLGLTYSTPAIGRVRYSGDDKFIVLFGGGKVEGNGGGQQGQRVFVVDALRRQVGTSNQAILIGDFDRFQRGGVGNLNIGKEIIARPATYRRPGSPYMDSAFVAGGPSLFTMRFGKPDGTQWGSTTDWTPDEFFDPTSSRNEKQATNPSVNTPINRVVEIYAGNAADPNDPPRYQLDPDGTLPLASAPPILNRPKLGNSLVSSGGKPDLYVGTGNSDKPEIPGTDFEDANYFYAVHDFNDQLHGASNDGRALWVAKFCAGRPTVNNCDNASEQVVSEPAIISSCVIVATYQPTNSSSCVTMGDTTLYGFNLITGALTSCLVYPPGSPWAGSATPVVRLTGAGIPSDLVVINDNLYFQTSNNPGVSQVTVRQAPRPGAVRSYRRLK